MWGLDKSLLGPGQPYVPAALQRTLLAEDAAAAAAAGMRPLAANRLAACATPTGALLCYPVGVNAEALALLPIQLGGSGEEGEEEEGEAPPPKVRAAGCVQQQAARSSRRAPCGSGTRTLHPDQPNGRNCHLVT